MKTQEKHQIPLLSRFEQLIKTALNVDTKLNVLHDAVERQSVILNRLESKEPFVNQNEILRPKGASKILDLEISTIYSKCCRGELPHIKRNGRLYFLHSDLMEYLKEGKCKTSKEIDAEVDAYLSNNKKG